MKKVLGIFAILVIVCVVTAIGNDRFLIGYNVENNLRRIGLFGIIGIGAAFVIITSGIDLSIGSVIALVGCLLPMLIVEHGVPIPLAVLLLLVLSLGIGLLHGLLITKLRLQPFVVTLCGLLIYRGIARWITSDDTQGFENGYKAFREIGTGSVPIGELARPYGSYAVPYPFLIMVALAILAGIFLNKTIYGRYLLALGRNEQAARFSGINTNRMTIVAYVICSLMAGLAGILFSLDLNSVQPASHGEFYELYAIAAAVLGGCSLRGGEGSILGVVFGTALIRMLYNASSLLGIPTQLEFAIIGVVILAGALVD